MTTNQTAPVTDEELDQMIWKLERDGMTPKMLSLMRELREVRRAVTPTDDERIMAIEGIAPPAPVVPGVIATDDISYSVGRFRTHRDCYRDGWNACRAAMLNHSVDTADMAEPVSNRDELMPGIKPAPELDSVAKNAESLPSNSPATPDGWIPVSEKMPEVGVKVLCFPVEDEPIHASFNGQLWLQDISWSVSDESIDNVISCNVTHWQPLPAAPKEVG